MRSARKIHYLILLVFMLMSLVGVFADNSATSATSATSDKSTKVVDLAKTSLVLLLPYAQLLEDIEGQLSWQQALNSNAWSDITNKDLNLGITQSSYWFKVRIKYSSDQTRMFQIHYPLLDYVDFYLIAQNQLIKHIATGDARAFNSREVVDKDFVFKADGKKDQVHTLLIRANTQGTMSMPLSSVDIEYYAQEEALGTLGFGLYFGITFAMLLYNFMLYLYLKEQSYLYYCLFVATTFISAISYTGHGFYWLWPNFSGLNSFMATLTASLTFLAVALFFNSFLRVRTRGVLGRRVFYSLISLSILVITCSLLLSYSSSLAVIFYVQIVFTVLVLSYSFYLWRQGIAEARYFTLAWLAFIIGSFINTARVVGILPTNDFTLYVSLYGIVIEMLMLSMGLAYRFEIMREIQVGLSQELRIAQQDAIANLEKYRDLFQQSPVGLFRYDRVKNTFYHNLKTSALIGENWRVKEFLAEYLKFSDYKVLLKQGEISDKTINVPQDKYYSLSLLSVRDESGRVVEIEGTLTDISEQKHAEFSRITNELEKLNTLTQLVVGISHQFNTPLGVLITTEDLVKESLAQALADLEGDSLKKEELMQTLYMISDAINLSSDNTKVMSRILKDLRYSINTRTQLNVSSIDLNSFFSDLLGYYKAQLKEEDRDCLLTLDLTINNVDHINSDYDILSDVFLRLYSNTFYHAHADARLQGKITIKLWQDSDYVYIEYLDDGRGLDEDEKENIFVPFFTGRSRQKENSGLGMFIVHNQVVKILQGRVELLMPLIGFGIKIILPKI